ncbi:MAG: CheA signal transduction histidine kinase, partial [Rhodopila sp.]|nr:CheA signal transduction histidine kinase [Rhodopila sp.]
MSGSDPTQIFLQEAQDLLEQLEQTLLDLEYTPADTDLIDTAFRALHTIKGSGAMFGFDAVAAFTHHVENAFDLVRKGKLTPTKELIAVALRAKDQMRVLIDHPSTASASGGEAILSDLLRLMEAATGSSAAGGDRVTGSADAAAEADAEASWRVRFRLPIDAMATGTNPLLLLDELRGLGTASVVALTDAVPLLEEIDPGATYLHWDVLLRTDQPRAAIEEVFIFVIDDMELEIERPVPPIGEVAPRRIEDLAGAADAAEKPDAVVPVPVESSPVESGGPQDGLADRRSAKRGNDTVRVPAERLDELMDRVGELVIAQSRLKQV